MQRSRPPRTRSNSDSPHAGHLAPDQLVELCAASSSDAVASIVASKASGVCSGDVAGVELASAGDSCRPSVRPAGVDGLRS